MGVLFSALLWGFPMRTAEIGPSLAAAHPGLLSLIFFFACVLFLFSLRLVSNKKSDLKLFAIKQSKQKSVCSAG